MKKILFIINTLVFIVVNSNLSAEVLIWVQYTKGAESYSNLTTSHGGVNPKDVLTAIGLQFWKPTSSGGLSKSVDDPAQYVTWAHNNGIKVYLTVFNADAGTWNWGLATSAFGNANAFAQALVTEANNYNLDGIDLDLEGNNLPSDDNRTQFNTFITTLSSKIKANTGTCKILTVCTFGDPIDANKSNCPNTTWWKDWVGKVDNIHTMLYAEGGDQGCPGVGVDANDDNYWYSVQQKVGTSAGYKTSAVSMGVPTFDSENGAAWQTNVTTHLNQIYDIKASICMWDLLLANSGWQTSSTIWQKLKSFKDLLSAYTLTVTAGSGGTVTKNPDLAKYTPGTEVTLTATPNSGNTFTGWGGALSGSQNPTKIIMDDYKTVTASFGGSNQFDAIAGSDWDTAADVNKSKITFTNSNGTVSSSWTIAKAPNEDADMWVSLSAQYAGDYSPLTSIKITYTSSDPLIISLTQPPISDSGAGYMYELPASSTAATKTLQADDKTFKQPSWVVGATPLTLSKLTGLDFSPGVEASTTAAKSGTFVISELVLYGVSFNTPVITSHSAIQNKGVNVFTTHSGLLISGLSEPAQITVYDIAGRSLVHKSTVASGARGAAYLALRDCAAQAAFIRIETGRRVFSMQVPLGF